jgi:hypothetical protein
MRNEKMKNEKMKKLMCVRLCKKAENIFVYRSAHCQVLMKTRVIYAKIIFNSFLSPVVRGCTSYVNPDARGE